MLFTVILTNTPEGFASIFLTALALFHFDFYLYYSYKDCKLIWTNTDQFVVITLACKLKVVGKKKKKNSNEP